MNDVSRVLKEIAYTSLHQIVVGKSLVEPKAVASLACAVDKLEDSPIKYSIGEVLRRVLEITILSDPEIINLHQYWDALHQNADRIIRDRLSELFDIAPPIELIRHIAKCLRGVAAQRGRQKGGQKYYLDELFEREALANANRELRCNVCGYHFRVKDLGNDKCRKALDYDLVLAKSVHPGRNEDSLRPIVDQSNNLPTQLTIDHISPEEGFGWTELDNLQLLCRFCNEGKLSFRYPLEPLSYFAAGGLSNYPPERSPTTLRKVIIVATMRAYGGICAICNASTKEKEMTVRLLPVAGAKSHMFAPWNLQAICYDCYLAQLEIEDSTL